MEIQEIKKIIREKYPEYDKSEMKDSLDKIDDFEDTLREELEKYLLQGESPACEKEGYDFERLIEEKKLHPIGAFLALDWLRREPEKAKEEFTRTFPRNIL
jgi:hypothetical protein